VVGYRKLSQLNRQKLCFGILFIKFITKHSFGSSLAGTSRFFPLNSLARTRSPSVGVHYLPSLSTDIYFQFLYLQTKRIHA
ncbi:MAG: hypothetical protein OEW87_12725, partial [Flavobacteriaceae bacterium]|nr:hypothetical protein [Flavobacteriaceae bacterium]